MQRKNPDRKFIINAVDLSVHDDLSKKLVEILAMLRSYDLKGDKRQFMDPESISDSVNRYDKPSKEEGFNNIITLDRKKHIIKALRYMTDKVNNDIQVDNELYTIFDLIEEINFSLNMENNSFKLEGNKDFSILYNILNKKANDYMLEQIEIIDKMNKNNDKIEAINKLKGIKGSFQYKLFKKLNIERKKQNKYEEISLNTTDSLNKK